MKQFFLKLTLFCTLLFFCSQTDAQVTIGSGEAPIDGALLQLKQNEDFINADKGLGLPRVQLTDKENLFPMFVAGSQEYSGANKTREDEDHIGLVVYNTSQCDNTFVQGVYVWDGKKWRPILDSQPKGMPTITLNGVTEDTIHIISGIDARGTIIPPVNFSVTYNPSDVPAVFKPTGGYTAYDKMFSVMPAWNSGVAENIVSPTTYSLQPVAMNAVDFPGLATNPWQKREWKLYYEIPGNDCTDNQAVTKELHLFQENYAMLSENIIEQYYLDGSTYSFTVKSNVDWRVKSVTGSTNIFDNVNDILAMTGLANTTTGVSFSFKTSNLIASNGNGLAVIVLEDPKGLASNLSVNINGCTCGNGGKPMNINVEGRNVSTHVYGVGASSKCWMVQDWVAVTIGNNNAITPATPCPAGWRLPTTAEFVGVYNTNNVYPFPASTTTLFRLASARSCDGRPESNKDYPRASWMVSNTLNYNKTEHVERSCTSSCNTTCVFGYWTWYTGRVSATGFASTRTQIYNSDGQGSFKNKGQYSVRCVRQ